MENKKNDIKTNAVIGKEKSVFNTLNTIDVGNHVEKKGNLNYLSWAWAWCEVKKNYPNASYTIYETTNPQGYVCNYFTDGKTCWVKTGVTIEGIEHIEELPVMDYNNRSILLEKVTSFDINKTIQRSLTKAVARHGLGLYIYAGEDLPESERDNVSVPAEEKVESITNAQIKKIMDLKVIVPNVIKRYNVKDLTQLTYSQAQEIIDIKERQLNNKGE